MPRNSSSSRMLALALLTTLFGACSHSDLKQTPTAPGQPEVRSVATWLTSSGRTDFRAWPGKDTGEMPMVLVQDQFGYALAGASVKFTASAGSSIENATGVTDRRGWASSGKWVLGVTEGQYTVTASVDGLAPVTFRATAHKSVVVDAYKLEMIGGRSLPETLYRIEEGRLQFRDDSTFAIGYTVAGKDYFDPTHASGTYYKVGSDYGWDCCYDTATARFKDNRLYVHYADDWDFEDEVYIKVP